MSEDSKNYCGNCIYMIGEECGHGPCEGSIVHEDDEACEEYEEVSHE